MPGVSAARFGPHSVRGHGIQKKKKENDYANAQVQAPPSVMNFCTGDQILNVDVSFPKTSTVANRPLPPCMELIDFSVPHVDAGTQP